MPDNPLEFGSPRSKAPLGNEMPAFARQERPAGCIRAKVEAKVGRGCTSTLEFVKLLFTDDMMCGSWSSRRHSSPLFSRSRRRRSALVYSFDNGLVYSVARHSFKPGANDAAEDERRATQVGSARGGTSNTVIQLTMWSA
jgi:hypothetical protein